MLIVAKTEFKRIPINMIIPHENLDYKVPYYCMRCKSYIFSVNRDVAAVWMGEGYPEREIPNNMGWVEFFCHGCKRTVNFYFQ